MRALDKLGPYERTDIVTPWAPDGAKRVDINSDYRVELGRGETEAIILVNTPITASDQISMLESKYRFECDTRSDSLPPSMSVG